MGDLQSPLLDTLPWLSHGFGTRAPSHADRPTAWVKQIHSSKILDTSVPGPSGEADALITGTQRLAVAVKTADCLPILLADAERGVVAAVHAGWRGTVQEIVRHTIERMHDLYGTHPRSIFAAVGPGIGRCCFEVGPEVAREFARWQPRLAQSVEKEHLDLGVVNYSQLVAAGVPENQICRSTLCTVCNPDLFFSYRREREQAGRMQSWIAANPD